jgi:uncharacterized protein (DUF1499 family)
MLFIGTAADGQKRLVKILEAWSGAKIITQQENYIRAQVSSKIFGFVDDLEFYLPATTAKPVIIHLRSASRMGHSDLGVNQKRIEKIRDRFNAD